MRVETAASSKHDGDVARRRRASQKLDARCREDVCRANAELTADHPIHRIQVIVVHTTNERTEVGRSGSFSELVWSTVASAKRLVDRT